jgi:hypothetical protein
MDNVRTLNKLLKEQRRDAFTEVTRKNNEYWLLHICKNGTSVPLFHSTDASQIRNVMLLYRKGGGI